METMASAFADQYPFTTDQIAHELNMEINTFRVWKNKLEMSGILTRPKIGGHLCIKDPNLKSRLLYSQEYVNKLKELRARMPTRRRKKDLHKQSALRNAIMTITVPIFDPNIANFIQKKFSDEFGLENHLKEYINSLAMPALSKIEELRKKHAEELERMMKEI